MSDIRVRNSDMFEHVDMTIIQSCYDELRKLYSISNLLYNYKVTDSKLENKYEHLAFLCDHCYCAIYDFENFIKEFFPNIILENNEIICEDISGDNDFKYCLETIVLTAIDFCNMFDNIFKNYNTIEGDGSVNEKLSKYDIRSTMELIMNHIERYTKFSNIKLNPDIQYEYKIAFINYGFGRKE